MSDRAKGVLSMLASAFGFALMAMFVRLCDDFGSPISSFQKSFFRNLLALVLAFAVFWGHHRRVPVALPTAKGWGIVLLRSVLGTIGIFANFYALSHIPIAEGQALNKTAPFFTVIFAWGCLGERASLKQLGALALAFVGVLLIVKPGFAGAATLPLTMGLVGGLCAGAAYACVRQLGLMKVEGALIILFFSFFSCLTSIPFMWHHFDAMTLGQVLSLLGAGLGAAIGQFGITAAYRFAAPRSIAVFDYANILFTAVLGFAFFAQVPDVWSMTGFALVISAAATLFLL